MSLTTSVSLEPSDQRSETHQLALSQLSNAVYPPSEVTDWPGRHLEWSLPEWDVFVFTDQLGLVSYTGVVQRDAQHNGDPVRLGGIGGVKTHPKARGSGFAAVGIGKAQEFFEDSQPPIEFALLVCNNSLVEYYARLGWKQFYGDVLTSQDGEPKMFDFNNVMVSDVDLTAPSDGTIDLLGPPW